MSKTQKSKSDITYEGKVKVQLYHGKKVYKTIKEKNKGVWPLFNFFINCLMGNYYDAQRPMYLRVYNVNAEAYIAGEEGNISERDEVTTTAIPVRKVTAKPAADGDAQASAIFEFLIPAATLTDNGSGNLLVLFSTENRNMVSKPSAEVLLETPITKESGTSNIKVEWELVIGNK